MKIKLQNVVFFFAGMIFSTMGHITDAVYYTRRGVKRILRSVGQFFLRIGKENDYGC